jgi:hypothetical protein
MRSASQASVREIFAGPATREDGELVWMLVALFVLDIALAGYLSLFPVDAGFLYFIVGIMLGALAFDLAGLLRLKRHYSFAGIFWFITSIGAFQAWNIVVMWVTLGTRWWAHHQPGYHIGVGAAVGIVPLLVGIWKFGSKVSTARKN